MKNGGDHAVLTWTNVFPQRVLLGGFAEWHPDGFASPALLRQQRQSHHSAWAHYFDWGYAQRHKLAKPLTFGTVKSRLCQVIEAGHYQVALTRDETQAVKTWIALNCPLWPDYLFRPERKALAQMRAGE